MFQLDLLATPSRAAGEAAAQACIEKAVRITDFDAEHARVFVLGYLATHGPSWGEDIVDAARASGRADLAPHDLRCWGQVFATLVRRSRIKCLRSDGIRRHGNACSGARQWALVL